jgi:diaminohydroxyphosphoribosylaminopyrimidine deaminase / 5-amino-6-(5-phosphoribosylamino)uracil reductase
MAGSRSRNAHDELFMLECLLLAGKGKGRVSPNPCVGALLVGDHGVISRGFHHRFGGPHAEPLAIASARGRTEGSTLYVNLEPCNHYGRTPPCTEAIIDARISRVVVGMVDPNPLVAGKGIRRLRSAGIRVDVGILGDECRKLNESFCKYVTTSHPFVTLKVAQTLDGKIADMRGTSKWITHPASRSIVHRLRGEYDAILVGGGTVRKDDPELSLHGALGRSPLRVVVSGMLDLPAKARLWSSAGTTPTLIITSSRALKTERKLCRLLERDNVEILPLPSSSSGTIGWHRIFGELGKRGVTSVLVEGGGQVFGSILGRREADKVVFFVAPAILGSGKDAFSGLTTTLGGRRGISDIELRRIGADIMISGYFKG